MLLVTLLAAVFLIDGRIEPIAGGILVAIFVVYVISILLVIQRGWLRPLDGRDVDDDAEQQDEGNFPRR